MSIARKGMIMVLLGVLLAGTLACSGPSSSESTAIPSGPEGVLPATSLTRDCLSDPSFICGDITGAGLAAGERAVDFPLLDIHGDEYRLSELLTERPVVMIFGSFT